MAAQKNLTQSANNQLTQNEKDARDAAFCVEYGSLPPTGWRGDGSRHRACIVRHFPHMQKVFEEIGLKD
jgi:hypothetical protein